MSSTERNSDRIARLTRQVDDLTQTVSALEDLIKSNVGQSKQVIWCRIDSHATGNRWKATSLDVHDRTSAQSLPKRSETANLYVHAIGSSNPHPGDVVAAANIRGIWTILNPRPSGELYFAHFRDDQNQGFGNGSSIGWKDPSLISAGTLYNNLFPFDWSTFAGASKKFDTGAFLAAPDAGALAFKQDYQPGEGEIYHLEWSGTFHHGHRENFTTNPTNVPSSTIAFAILSGAAGNAVLDSKPYVRQPYVMDDAVADEVHFEHDDGINTNTEFKKKFQSFEPVQFSLHAAIPKEELETTDGSIFELRVADVTKTRPGTGINPTPVPGDSTFRARITGSTIRIYST